VQLLLSKHGSVLLLVNTHPFTVSQVSAVQGLLSLQLLAVPPQTSLVHTSLMVQALLSLQAVPFGCPMHEGTQGVGASVRTQLPEAVSQESIVQVFWSSQFFGVPVQTLFEHTSFKVQGLLSLQGKVFGLCTQPPGITGTHKSVVQILLSSQLMGVPVQTPLEQTSPAVQLLPSLHDSVLLVKTHPVAVLQVSVVQTLLSLHLTAT